MIKDELGWSTERIKAATVNQRRMFGNINRN
jgi:hypothetical protein